MEALKYELKRRKISITSFAKRLKVCRLTAHRMVSGERFTTIHNLFLRIYEITQLTPNDILGIPPKDKD